MNAITEGNFKQSHFGNVPLQNIVPSKTNPRKRFPQAELEELAESIKTQGLAQPILLRPIPPVDGMIDTLEIVAGERRWRAIKLTAMTEVPALVRNMSDIEALEIQVIENQQRKDVHPIEEAEGYHQLMVAADLSANDVAKRLGLSKAYVIGRLKLLALCEPAREAFFEGKINASTALLIARIPVPGVQLRATEEIINNLGSPEPMAYRQALQHIRGRYMLDLKQAVFPINSPKLVKFCGACTSCPKRTGSNPELYPDVDPDICTDPDCFEAKAKAHNEKLEAAATKAGVEILPSKDSWSVTRDRNLVSGDSSLWNMDRVSGEHKNGTAVSRALGEKAPAIKVYFKSSRGELIPAYDYDEAQAALESLGVCLTEEQDEQRRKEAEKEAKAKKDPKQLEKERQERKEEAEREKRAKLETIYNNALYEEVRKVLIKPENLKRALGFALAQYAAEWSIDSGLVKKYYKANINQTPALESFIATATTEELIGLVIDIAAGTDFQVSEWNIRTPKDIEELSEGIRGTLEAEAAEIGVDVAAIRAEIFPPEPEKTPATPPKKAAKKASAAKGAAPTDEAQAQVVADATPERVLKEGNAANPAWPFPTGYRPKETKKGVK